MGDQVAGVVEVELLDALASREPGGADPALSAVGVAGGNLALQAGRQILLMGPGLGPRPLGEPGRAGPGRAAESRNVCAFNARVKETSLLGRSRLAVTDFVAAITPSALRRR